MASITPNMSLAKWDQLDDFFNYADLVSNWDAIDEHDHTTGNGVQISGGGIAVGAIESSHIQSEAITEDKLAEGSISSEKLILNTLDGAVLNAGSVADTALAYPVRHIAGRWDTLVSGVGTVINDLASGKYFFSRVSSASLLISGSDIVPNSASPACWYFASGDRNVADLQQYFQLRGQVSTNNTAWSSVTATFGLYPVSFAGGNDVLTVTLGTAVSGSTFNIADPIADDTTPGYVSVFTIPSSGLYCLGVETNAALTANAASLLTIQLQTMNAE